eukprot:CAMPEP_0172488984 /NCGR_PEP_ID=MMETSP1066-20121228/18720_1 /TAXON_ID=671091 /ORGANISM="Coscinodiscus wailesii, Strain CCMP2513" /LENGTH=59 /DNA_ID=CAMNT_0013256537 /DNA_START=9 /DNA_END=185 /DNA_ORIENTATION=+
MTSNGLKSRLSAFSTDLANGIITSWVLLMDYQKVFLEKVHNSSRNPSSPLYLLTNNPHA